MSGTFEVFIPGDERFPAPNMSVGAVASSIKGKSDDSTFEAILRHTTCNVGVVVLHSDQFRSALLLRPFGGEVIGVEVVGDDLRADFEDPLQMLDSFVEV